MTITKVWLDESKEQCIVCGLCELTCPKVFEVDDKMKVKKCDLDCQEKIKKAAEDCPVQVIALEYNKSGRRDNKPEI